MNSKQAVIFDMDGVLIDSYATHGQIVSRTVADLLDAVKAECRQRSKRIRNHQVRQAF